METKLIIFSLAVITVYLLIIYILFKKLPSISQSYYEFEKKYGKRYTWVFSIALILFASPLMIAGLSITEGNTYQFLMFLSPAGIMFVAAAPQFMSTLTRSVHFWGAGIGISTGLLSIIWTYKQPDIFLFVILLIAGLGWSKCENKIYWLEVIVIYSIPLTMFYVLQTQ